MTMTALMVALAMGSAVMSPRDQPRRQVFAIKRLRPAESSALRRQRHRRTELGEELADPRRAAAQVSSAFAARADARRRPRGMKQRVLGAIDRTEGFREDVSLVVF